MAACMRHVKKIQFAVSLSSSSFRSQFTSHHSFPVLSIRKLSQSVPRWQHRSCWRWQGIGRQNEMNGWLRSAAVTNVRWNSTTTSNATSVPDASNLTSLPEGYIPEPPPIPEALPPPEVAEPVLNALGEVSLQSLGLCGWTPPGMMQWALESIHVGLDIPWWSTIALVTVGIRILIFPLVILAQRNAASMHNHMPTIQRLQEKFTQSRMSGNPMEAAQAGYELSEYMKRNKVNPVKSMIVPLAQLPIFVSVFVGIRKMANLPVESMKTGGLFWFTDLTAADPFYLMPLMTMATFLVTVEFGVDGMKAGQMSHGMKWFMRAMPVVMLPLIINFPAAMLCYWFTSNAFSLCQVMILKIPSVREFFKIPVLVKHPEHLKPKKKKVPTATLR